MGNLLTLSCRECFGKVYFVHLSQCAGAVRPWRSIREGVARLQGRQVQLTIAVHILIFIICMGIVKIILQIQNGILKFSTVEHTCCKDLLI